MSDKIERKQDLDELMEHLLLIRDLWEITREEMTDAHNVLLKSQNKQELTRQEIAKINRRPVSNYTRERVLKYMGFVILTTDLMDELANYLQGKRVLEVMAGNGSLSKCLQDRGINIKATDNEVWATKENSIYSEWKNAWTNIENIDVLDAVRKYGRNIDTIVISWPPYKSKLPLQMMRLLQEINPKVEVIYIGESAEGCTADDEFYKKTFYVINERFKKVQSKFIRWDGFRDNINIVRLK